MDLRDLLVGGEDAEALDLHDELAELLESLHVVFLGTVDVIVIANTLDLNLVEFFGCLGFIRIHCLVIALSDGF